MTTADKVREILSTAAEEIAALLNDKAGVPKESKDYYTFDAFRTNYPGKKRGNLTELTNLKKKVKDWKDVLPLLLPALKNQINWRKRADDNRVFTPPWKNMQTWVNQRCWEETEGKTVAPIKTKYQTEPTALVHRSLKIEHPDPPKPKNDVPVPTIEEMIQEDINNVKEHNDLFSIEQNVIPLIAGIKFQKLWNTRRWRPTPVEVERFNIEARDQYIQELMSSHELISSRAAIDLCKRDPAKFDSEYKSKIGVIAETLAYIHYLKIQTT